MKADHKELIAELRKLSAYIENRGGIRVRVDRSGGCGPATAFECELWDALEAAERDAVDLEQFRPAVETWMSAARTEHEAQFTTKSHMNAVLSDGRKLLAIIDSQKDAALPAPPKKED